MLYADNYTCLRKYDVWFQCLLCTTPYMKLMGKFSALWNLKKNNVEVMEGKQYFPF